MLLETGVLDEVQIIAGSLVLRVARQGEVGLDFRFVIFAQFVEQFGIAHVGAVGPSIGENAGDSSFDVGIRVKGNGLDDHFAIIGSESEGGLVARIYAQQLGDLAVGFVKVA